MMINNDMHPSNGNDNHSKMILNYADSKEIYPTLNYYRTEEK